MEAAMDAKAFDSLILFLSVPYMGDKRRISFNKPGVLCESGENYVVKSDWTCIVRRDIVIMVAMKTKK